MPILPFPQTNGVIESLFGPQDPSAPSEFRPACEALLLSAALGCAVAGFYLFSTRRRVRTPGLGGTLVLLAMLITLVTIAIGNNAAKAFTLVGTLAIVRFRTPIGDIRDTAFVIFAVAVGIAIGAFNPWVAVAGTVVVGAASMALSSGGAPPAADESLLLEAGGRLTLRFDKAGAHQHEVEPVIAAHARIHRLMAARGGKDGGVRLVYALDIDRTRAMALVDALHGIESIRRVGLTFGEVDDDD